MASLSQKYVGRLDIPMDDPGGMGHIERIRDLDPNPEISLSSSVQGAPGDAVLQRQPFEKLHRNKGRGRPLRRCRGSCRCWDG